MRLRIKPKIELNKRLENYLTMASIHKGHSKLKKSLVSKKDAFLHVIAQKEEREVYIFFLTLGFCMEH